MTVILCWLDLWCRSTAFSRSLKVEASSRSNQGTILHRPGNTFQRASIVRGLSNEATGNLPRGFSYLQLDRGSLSKWKTEPHNFGPIYHCWSNNLPLSISDLLYQFDLLPTHNVHCFSRHERVYIGIPNQLMPVMTWAQVSCNASSGVYPSISRAVFQESAWRTF
jgi:hypothetical protein